ncbi:MAG: YlxR family protein [Bacilli bacterium]|nr:YlxR family protein [Bacilli bacterium]
MKKIPMRMCVVTHEKLPKKELLRIVKTEDGIIVDETGKVNGHGCYIKKSIETLELAKKSKVLNKVLETELTEEVYKNIEEIINK